MEPMKTGIPHATLGQVLTKSEEWINLDPSQTYQQVTIKLWGQGVVLRNEVSGAEIAASRRLKVRGGQFILSRIDARNGALGLVPPSLDGAVVSNDFPTFNVDIARILPDYLGWMSKTHDFVELCKAASEGTTNRVRLQEDRFLGLQIPLPPLADQRRIVARIEELAAKIAEARGLRREAVEEAEALLFTTTRQIFNAAQSHPAVPLETVCTAIIDNLHSNPIYADDGIPCIRSSDVGWGKLFLGTARRTTEEEYRHRTLRGEPTTDDIVLVREGGGTGKAAIVENGQRFSLGQRVMMIRPDQRQVSPKFFLYQILSPTVFEDHILPLSKGSASPHLNISSLRSFPFTLPPIDEQRRIVAYLDSLQAKVDALKALQAETAAELDALLPSVLDRAFKGEL
jgi:type I restriction enzyme S subunit